MRTLVKKLLGPLLQKASAFYLKKPRRFSYKGISVIVEPTVFPPFLTFSTKILMDFIAPLELQGKTFLELGCGCGIISIFAAKNGAVVTATDINDTALGALKENAVQNDVGIEILHSDLFANLKGRKFDMIVINPPYYPKNPGTAAESAWFCGENFEYFENLFAQLPDFITAENLVCMILSEDCQIKKIKAIANRNGIAFVTRHETKTAAEKNFIFRLASA
jgi:release factor glutamine methyltransferase